MADLYLEAAQHQFRQLFGKRRGILFTEYKADIKWAGRDEYRSRGDYAWCQQWFMWPGDQKEVWDEIAYRLKHHDADVFFCTSLRDHYTGDNSEVWRSRKQTDSTGILNFLHVDHDKGNLTKAMRKEIEDLGALTIRSGTPGNYHIYIPLAPDATPAQYDALEREMRRRFEGDDKIASNDLLRVAGTINWKNGRGDTEVIIEDSGSYEPIDPAILLKRWGVDESNYVEPVGNTEWIVSGGDIDGLVTKGFLRKCERGQDEDLSKVNYRIIRLCQEKGWDAPQTFTFMTEWLPEGSYKDQGSKRLSEDIARIFAKNAAGGIDAGDGGGEFDPTEVDAMGHPQDPDSVAVALANGLWRGARRIHHKQWYEYVGSHYRPVDMDDIDTEIRGVLKEASYSKQTKDGGVEDADWPVRTAIFREVMNQLPVYTRISSQANVGDWIDAHGKVSEGGRYMHGMLNGLYDFKEGDLIDHTDRYFNTSGVVYEYDAEAKCPRWNRFLNEVWPGDKLSQNMLGEWFGYVLSGDVDRQVYMLLKGRSGSGKGTIQRLMEKLVGNTVSISLDTFVENFGMADLIGTQLAIVGEARTDGKLDTGKVVQRILGMTGKDTAVINRKHISSWKGVLRSRLMMSANEFPWFKDAAGALRRRTLLLAFNETFEGAGVDGGLDDKLELELPGIFNWALGGLKRLNANDEFTWSENSLEELRSFDRMVNPVLRFINDRCVRGAEYRVSKFDAWNAYKKWCSSNGVKVPDIKLFGRHVHDLGLKDGRTMDAGRKGAYVGMKLKISEKIDGA